MDTSIRVLRRKGRHERTRKKVIGTADRPRLSVFRSHKHTTVQLIDDSSGKVVLSCSTGDSALRKQIRYGGNVEAAKTLGKILAGQALSNGFKKIIFDRSGYFYHGRVKALAEAAREGGLQF